MPKFPFEQPADGVPVEVADGVFWARLTIPYVLNHVNVYLLRDGEGWLGVDTCIDYPVTRQVWSEMIDRFGRLDRLLLTHFHVDHTGAAGWLHQKTGCRILMSPVENEAMKHVQKPWDAALIQKMHDHYLWLGCGDEEADRFARARWVRPGDALLPPEPETLLRLDDALHIGNREWRVLTGSGHSPDGVLLYCAADRILIAGDQILPTISPFIGTTHHDRHANPLGEYLASLDRIGVHLHPDTLVLPGHGLPFRGVTERLAALHVHHEERNGLIIDACRTEAITPRTMIGHVFRKRIEGVESMALAETLSHINWLAEAGRLEKLERDGVLHLRAAA